MKRIKKESKIQRLSFYESLPVSSTNHAEFIDLIKKRTGLLRQVESSITDLQASEISSPRDDVLSHFFCRLICSQTLWSVHWFVKTEAQLFRNKINSYPLFEIREFFYDEYVGHLSGIEVDEGNKTVRILQKSKYEIEEIAAARVVTVDYDITIHFTKIQDLVSRRAVRLDRGYTKMSNECMKSILVNEFRNHLNRKMMSLYHKMTRSGDERLWKICNDILCSHKGPTVSASISDLDTCLPPCISGLISRLKKNRHLKYKDRQSLTLFLKDSGMSVEACIQFFRNLFKVSKDVFDKNYLYSIRHNYGLEGKRANYTSYSCSKMIDMMGDRDAFGCPFAKNMDYVMEYCNDKKVECSDIEELGRGGHHQKACSLVLERIIGRNLENYIVSPIQFLKTMKNPQEKNK
jgi:DNA primase large subunit